MHRARSSASTIFVSVAALLWCDRALADRLVVVIAPQKTDALDAVIRERAAGTEVVIEHRDAIEPSAFLSTQANDALAHVWIDFTNPDRATLVLLDRSMEHGLLRKIPRARGDEIAREEIGHMLETAVEGLLAGLTIGVSRETMFGAPPKKKKPPPAPAPLPPPPPPPEPSPWHARAGGLYGLEAFGAGTAAQGPGGFVDVLHRAGGGWIGVRALGQMHLPTQVTVSPLTIRIATFGVRAALVGSLPLGSGFSAEAMLGGGLDVMHVVPLRSTRGSIEPPGIVLVPMLRAAVGLAWGPPRIALLITTDVDLSGMRFDVLDNGARRTLFAPNTVRPGIAIEVGTP